MRMQRLEIENFRCIQKFSLGFTDPRTGQPSPFAAIVGPNGAGKTFGTQVSTLQTTICSSMSMERER